MVTAVFLARHGRTVLNAEGRLRGLSDPPLDDVGRAEAARLAAAVAVHRPTVVVSSPLQRAVSTAQAIASVANVPMVVDDRLNDRDYGPWTGELRSEVERRFGSVDEAPGVEKLADVASRAVVAWSQLTVEYEDGPLVLVSHDAFNSALLRALDPRLGDIRQRTGCYNHLSLVDGQWRVDYYDRVPSAD